MALTRTTKQAFTLAVAVHLLALTLVFVAILVNALKAEEEEPVVFELVDPGMFSPQPAEAQASPAERPEPPEPTPDEPLPELALPEFEDLKPVPEVELPEPEPPPRPEPPAQRQPAPQPRPTPPPEPQPQRISIDDFRRSNPTPTPRQPAPQPARRQVEAPAIRTDIRQALASSVQNLEPIDLSRLSSSQRDAVESYFAKLMGRLKAAFEPMGGGLTARVEFTVQANGAITNVRFLRRSGDTAFDNSVLQAFQRTRSPGSPPGNPPYTRTVTFTSDG